MSTSRAHAVGRTLLWIVVAAGISVPASSADSSRPLPSPDEAYEAQVDPSLSYRPLVSAPSWIVPSPALPPGLEAQASNTNVSIVQFQGRLFLAWRTAPTHFASARARMLVVSSPDLGRTWTQELQLATGHDLREPFLLAVNGRLLLYFVELGDHAYAFEPHALLRTERCGAGRWTPPERWGGPGEVTWDFKVRRGRVWMTSYRGKHYGIQPRVIEARFRWSRDGLSWADVGPGVVYRGGVSEVSFEFDAAGKLWAITRDEDGDRSGFGSHVATAEADSPGNWCFPERADPRRYDSPRMFRHGSDIYLVARRDLGTPAGSRWRSLDGTLRKLFVWASYSLDAKRTTLYRLDRQAHRFEPLLDLPSAGDTAFPSILRLGPHEFLIANYSSPLEKTSWSWFRGQLGKTAIYLVRLRFVPESQQVVAESRPGADDPVPTKLPLAVALLLRRR